jgi:hypothetical protein
MIIILIFKYFYKMESYIRYFKNILSFIVKPIIDKEYLLPISNTEDSVKL